MGIPTLGGGGRLNSDKTRYELFEPFAMEQLANVFTKGAKKYPNPPHNWLYGMKWSKMLASLKRHIAAFEKGEDRDFYPDTCPECAAGTCVNHTGELHMAQAAWNALGLTSYYKWYPQGDDRMHVTIPKPRIALDVDEVIANWVDAWCKRWDLEKPTSWWFDYDLTDRFTSMRETGELDEMYSNLEPLVDPAKLPFEPVCYISHRPVGKEITEQWLQKHGFPLVPVYHVKERSDKLKLINELNIDIFVDDSYSTFQEINQSGKFCYLKDAFHNRRFDVGHKRLNSLYDLKF